MSVQKLQLSRKNSPAISMSNGVSIFGILASHRFARILQKAVKEPTAYEPTYHLSPAKSLNLADVRESVQSTVDEMMSSYTYNSATAKQTSLELSDRVKAEILSLPCMIGSRYRIVTTASIGENIGQGASLTSQCIWSSKIDDFVTCTHEQLTHFCVVSAFLIYKE